MVEIHVDIADLTVAQKLTHRLAGLLERPTVSFDEHLNEVRVRSHWEASGIGRIIETVESWLAAENVDSASLWIGNRAFTMFNPRHGTETSRQTE